MAVNRGKEFEKVVQGGIEKVQGASIDRLHDQTTGFAGSSNICDFIVYKYPFQLYIECKTVHGNTLSIHSVPKPDKHGKLHGFYGNITDTQWEGLYKKAQIEGVMAGILCWWVDKDVTMFIPIELVLAERNMGNKSIRYDFKHGMVIMGKDIQVHKSLTPIVLTGEKKRVFFNYDMESFLKEVDNALRH